MVKYYKRAERHATLERGEVEWTEEGGQAHKKLTKEDITAEHERGMARSFNNWGKIGSSTGPEIERRCFMERGMKVCRDVGVCWVQCKSGPVV